MMEKFGIVDFKRKLKLGLPVIFLVIFLDRLTKILVVNNMELGETISVWGWFFKLTYVLNPNVAFSIRIGNSTTMLLLNILAIFILLIYFLKTKFSLVKIIALSMIVGGAFGNNYDRIKSGVVIDFLNFGTRGWRFAIFNIADASISVGIVILLISIIFFERDENQI
ncbi:MAG: signal peptidase II [bacterium]|nr:signal peptidase II [bacterium]